ncbi:MAG: hypothetical protein HPY57_14855 [Ignavibacteria bacterium]|nr:hypothetical protein [Ignavibacteria bacterium]
MNKIKVFIKKSKPTSWYSTIVGKTVEVFDKEFIINEKLAYEYVDLPNHIIMAEDILMNKDIRDKKLKRIIKN